MNLDQKMYALTLQFLVNAVGSAFSEFFKVYTICVCAYLLFPTPYLPYIYGSIIILKFFAERTLFQPRRRRFCAVQTPYCFLYTSIQQSIYIFLSMHKCKQKYDQSVKQCCIIIAVSVVGCRLPILFIYLFEQIHNGAESAQIL